MGISTSTLIRSTTVTSDHSLEPYYDLGDDEHSSRPLSRVSSLGPTASLIYGPTDNDSTRSPTRDVESGQGLAPSTCLDPGPEPCFSMPIPATCLPRAEDRPIDTTATRVEELRGSLSPVSLPPLLPRGDTFGDFIIEYPPRQLHLYPRVAG